MNETPIEALKQDVEGLHDCKARHTATEYVTETFEGETVWEGTVHIFALEGHPKASVCYAWPSPDQETDRRRFFAVLQDGPIKSAQEAVRVSLILGLRKSDDSL